MANLRAATRGRRAVALMGLLTSAVLACGAVAASGSQRFDADIVAPDQALRAKLPERIRRAGVLVIGSDTSYAPWESLSEKDGSTPEGIDVDIAGALARKLGLSLDYRSAPFDAIIPGLGSKYDLGISAFTITAERMQAVDFVSYFRSTNLWVVRKGNPASFDPHAVCGRRVVVQTGSSEETLVRRESEACAGRSMPVIDVLPFDTEEQCITRVATGGADAAITGSSVVGYAVSRSEGALETLKPEGALLDDTLDGIAVAKSEPDLAAAVADAINAMIADGTYGKIFQSWGVDGASIARAQVDPEPH